jgi:hypothetical protein
VFRYAVRIRSFDHRCSSCQESAASFSFRLTVRSSPVNWFLMNCCVIVEPPWTMFCEVGPNRSRHALDVDALVLPEAPVLDRHDRLLHHRGDLVGLDDDPALGPAQDGEHGLAVGRVDVAEPLGSPLLPRLELGELAGDRAHEPIRERHRHQARDDGEEREEPKLADPAGAPGCAAPTSSEQHEAAKCNAAPGGSRVRTRLRRPRRS